MGPDVFHRKLRMPDSLGAWAVRLCLVAVILACFFSAWIIETDARTSRRSSAGRAKKSSSSVSRSGRATRSARSSRSGSPSKSRSTGRRSARSRGSRAVSAPAHHGPTASQIRRQETSGSNDLEKRTDLERSYRAYDQGLSALMAGNYADATKHMSESYELYSDFHGSHDVLDSLYLFDLGQAAEAAGDINLAKNSYQRSLRRRPDFSDCCIRLSALLTKNGESALALVYARRLADKNRQDPRAQLLLSTMLEKAGFVEEGKAAKENFNLLMKGGSVNKLQKQTEPGDSEQETGKDGEQSVEKKQSDPVEKDEMPSGSGASKKTGADEKENESDAGAVKKPDP